jgi:uncharacterized protein DUF4153
MVQSSLPMLERKLAVGLVAAALALGVVADVLFNGRPLGLNVVLFAGCFVGALAALLRVGQAPAHQGRRWMALPLLLFSAAFVWHDSRLLTAVNLLALAGAVALGGLRRSAHRPQDATVSEYAAGLTSAAAGGVAGAVVLLRSEIPWQDAAPAVRSERTISIARGIGISLPVLLLFGGLFFAADSVFASYLTSAVPPLGNPLTHIALIALVGWVAAGLLRDLVAEREEDRAVSAESLLRRRLDSPLGATEVVIALAALDLLFLAFVVVQAGYLFGGRHLVESHAHWSYAQYARHGFFELVVVSALVLPVLLGANALVARKSVRLLSGVLIGLELIVAASALQRLRVYEQRYGLTELRIYAVGVVVWLGFVFIWAALTILRGRVRRFAVGALIAGFVATAALNVVNPDAVIVRTNLSRPQVDVAYLARLSDDAIPTLIERSGSLSPAQQQQLTQLLRERRTTSGGWLSWNLSRQQASTALRRLDP